MTSDAVGVASQGPTGIFPKVSHRGPAPHGSITDPERHFRTEWERLTGSISGLRRSVNVEERLSPDNFEDAFDLALEHPDFVDVMSDPFDEKEPNMVAHVRGHFRNVFNEEKVTPAFRVPSDSNFRALIRACELVYIDDAVLRFAPTWTFDPSFEDLDTMEFTEMPDQLIHWVEKVQVMWDALLGSVDLSRDETRGLVETLYGSRAEFVKKAMERDLFLPVPPPEYDETGPTPNLQEQFARRHEISPEDVHRYCYRRVLEDY